MPRSENLFHNLVTDEDSTTELLCNLMRFPTFRRLVLLALFETPLAADATFDQIETQCDLGRCGRADLLVRTESFCGIVEVKVTPWRGLTERQERDYVAYLSDQSQPNRSLAFLLPKGWIHLSTLERILADARTSSPSIGSHVAYWEEVLDVIEVADLHNLSPIFGEVWRLFAARFKPVSLSFLSAEVFMLFEKALPGALTKLDQLLGELQERAGSYKLQPTPRPRTLWPREEFGLYFKNESGQTVLWFGIWMAFWQQTGYPLCFGVDNNWPAPVRAAFTNVYSGQTHQFERWTLGAVPRETFMGDAPAEAIWNQLGPIVDAVTRAPSGKV